jgi:hypothetical protein
MDKRRYKAPQASVERKGESIPHCELVANALVVVHDPTYLLLAHAILKYTPFHQGKLKTEQKERTRETREEETIRMPHLGDKMHLRGVIGIVV